MTRKQKLLASLLVSAQLFGSVTPAMAFEAEILTDSQFDQEAYGEDYQNRYFEYLNSGTYSDDLQITLEGLLERSESVETNEQLNTLMNEFAAVYEVLDSSDAARYHADSEMLGSGLAEEVYSNIKKKLLDDGNVSRVIRFANHLAIGYSEGATGFYMLLIDLTNTNTITDAQKDLDNVFRLTEEHRDITAGGGNFALEIVAGKLTSPDLVVNEEPTEETKMPKEQIVTQPEEVVEPEMEIDVEIEDASKAKPAELSDKTLAPLERTGTYYEYDEAKGARVRVEYTVKVINGEEKREEKRTVEATGLTHMWSDRYSQFINKSVTTSRPARTVKEEKKIEKKFTIQYSLNKDSNFPVYVDTGIFTDENGNASYEDVYEALYQMAVNAEDGFLVEDTDKLLVVLEGKPAYIVEREGTYSKSEIESIFNAFTKVDLLVTETRIGTTDSLEWQLRTGQEQQVHIDGEQVEMTTKPQVRGERVVLPIAETMEAVGGVVEQADNMLTVRYDGKTVSFENGVAEARVDGKLVSLTVPVELDERGVHTTNLMPVLEALGIESVWDEQESTLFLNNTKRKEMIKQKEQKEQEDTQTESSSEEEKKEDTEEN